MKRINKLFAIVLSVFLISALFSACARERSETDENGVTVQGNKVFKGNYSEKEIIKVDYFDTGYGSEWIYEIAKDFVNENESYALYLSADSSLVTNMAQKLQTGKNLSDIYFTPHFDWETYAAQGVLTTLNDVFESKPDAGSDITIAQKMEEGYAEGCEFEKNGSTNYYVLPWTKLITGIAYNVNLFNEYGISVPTTMEEFEVVCQTIIAKSGGKIKPLVVPGKIGGYFDFIGMNWWIQASGLDNVKEFFAFDSAEVFNPAKQPYSGFVRALKEFQKFFGSATNQFEKYCLSGSMAKDAYSAQRDFINGKAAMTINADWLESEMSSLVGETGFKMKLMKVPFLSDAVKENGEYVSVNYAADANFACIPAKAKNPTGAKKFLTYMHKDSELKSFTKTTGCLRPFKYDYSSLRSSLSDFANSVLDINDSCSKTFFDLATGPRRFKAQKFVTANPYLSVVNGTSPEDFAKAEYAEAKVRWNKDWAV